MNASVLLVKALGGGCKRRTPAGAQLRDYFLPRLSAANSQLASLSIRA